MNFYLERQVSFGYKAAFCISNPSTQEKRRVYIELSLLVRYRYFNAVFPAANIRNCGEKKSATKLFYTRNYEVAELVVINNRLLSLENCFISQNSFHCRVGLLACKNKSVFPSRVCKQSKNAWKTQWDGVCVIYDLI